MPVTINYLDWHKAAARDIATQINALIDERAQKVAAMQALRASILSIDEKIKKMDEAAAVLGIPVLKAPVISAAPTPAPTPPAAEGGQPSSKDGDDDEDGFSLNAPSAEVGSAREATLAALFNASPLPLKVAQVREVIEKAVGRTVHAKTPGMTLYRLSEERKVHRIGRDWFYGPAPDPVPAPEKQEGIFG